MSEFSGPFRLPEKLATLVFDEGPLAGAEIECSLRLPFALFREIGAMNEPTSLTELRALFLEWGLRSWNLTDAKGPIPATDDGMARLEPTEQDAIIGLWLRGVVQLPAPLRRPSSATGKSPAPSKSRRRSRGPS